MEYALLNEAEVVTEIRFYDPPLNPDDIGVLPNGNKQLRPLIGDPAAPEVWQNVVGPLYDVQPTEVTRTWDYQDRPLAEVQGERLAELEALFADKRAEGFAFNADHFPLTDLGTKRQDLIRRSSSPGSFVVLNSSGMLVTMPNSQKNAWLTAGDDRFTALFTVHDQHVAGITATTTAEAAATYDITAGWPALAEAPLFEEPV